MKRGSSLQSELYKIIDENIGFQIHLSVYRMSCQHGSADLPRYWIYLIISTAQANGMDVEKYLTDLFSNPAGTILLPWNN